VFTPENGRDASSVDLYRTYARLHLRLFPYEWTLANAHAAGGRPILRPLGLAYPEMGTHPDDAYLFGDDLLVAPVVTRGARSRDVELPPGAWIDWWDGTSYAGRATIAAPLDKLPLVIREGALVPLLRPTIDTLAPASDPDVDSFANDPGPLWIRGVPGPARSSVLYDGTSLARDTSGAILIRSGATFARFVVEQIATPEPSVVTHDGVAIPRDGTDEGWTWEPAARGTLRVRLARDGVVAIR
jgi:alpha-D-xyloside xylohydrolase